MAANDHGPELRPPDWEEPPPLPEPPPTPANDAQFVGQSVPSSMAAGQAYEVTVTMRNSGTEVWTPDALYRLGSQNPHDNTTWGGRVLLSGPIAPGEDVVFRFTVTAPATPGVHHFQWLMVQEHVAWFGELTPDVAINVHPTSGWFHCFVNGAGAHGESGRVYVLLADTGEAFPARQMFWAHDGIKREILAAALTAIATGQSVGVELENIASQSRIMALHVG